LKKKYNAWPAEPDACGAAEMQCMASTV
jgi:hypothetical protein